jgi:hypothetical protein
MRKRGGALKALFTRLSLDRDRLRCCHSALQSSTCHDYRRSAFDIPLHCWTSRIGSIPSRSGAGGAAVWTMVSWRKVAQGFEALWLICYTAQG